MNDETATPARKLGIFRTLVVFVLLGPFFGGLLPYLVVLADVLGSASGSRSMWYGTALSFPLFALIGIPFAVFYFYAFGLLPALLSGVIVGLKERKSGPPSLAFNIAVGVAVGVLTAAAFTFLIAYTPLWPEVSEIPVRGLLLSNARILPFAIVAGSVLSILLCSRIIRRGLKSS